MDSPRRRMRISMPRDIFGPVRRSARSPAALQAPAPTAAFHCGARRWAIRCAFEAREDPSSLRPPFRGAEDHDPAPGSACRADDIDDPLQQAAPRDRGETGRAAPSLGARRHPVARACEEAGRSDHTAPAMRRRQHFAVPDLDPPGWRYQVEPPPGCTALPAYACSP